MKLKYLLILIPALLFLGCHSSKNKKKSSDKKEVTHIQIPKSDTVYIDEKGMFGSYKGLEFNEQGDIAHQFSNKVANVVGTYLKAKYREGLYLKIDLKNTKINTKDLDQMDSVVYTIHMPFVRTEKCNAFTGVEHCGSWNYQPNYFLKRRLAEQIESLKKISIGKMETRYYKTKEKFKEYWIQFKHKDHQSDCK
jgi:hypothetical protein